MPKLLYTQHVKCPYALPPKFEVPNIVDHRNSIRWIPPPSPKLDVAHLLARFKHIDHSHDQQAIESGERGRYRKRY